MNLKAYAAL